MSNILKKYPILKNRYAYVGLAFVIWITFLDQNNLFQQYKTYQELKRMEEKEVFLDEEIEKNKQMVEKLNTSPEELEKYARERYWMKRDNEDLFIILPDSVKSKDSLQ